MLAYWLTDSTLPLTPYRRYFSASSRLPVFDPKTGLLRPKDAADWNLVNLMLQLTGRCSEQALASRLLAFQGACCAAGFAVRWALEGIYK